jgi:hypothetical protein
MEEQVAGFLSRMNLWVLIEKIHKSKKQYTSNHYDWLKLVKKQSLLEAKCFIPHKTGIFHFMSAEHKDLILENKKFKWIVVMNCKKRTPKKLRVMLQIRNKVT